MKNTLFYIVFVVALSIFTVFVYQRWGLTGSGILIGFFVLLTFVSKYALNSSETKLAAKLEEMSDLEIIEALKIMKTSSPKDRDEIVLFLKKDLEKYAAILNKIDA